MAALIFVFTPVPASALNVDATTDSSERAAGESRSEFTAGESRSGLAAGAGLSERAAEESSSGLAAIREKFADLSGKDKTPSGTSGAGLDVGRFAKNLGTPPVDAVITKLPYTDTKAIAEGTHKVKIGDSVSDEILELKGYVYKITLEKGVIYHSELSSGSSDVFSPAVIIIDGSSNISEDVEEEELRADVASYSSGYFVVAKSGVYYMLVFDIMELIGGSAQGVGGHYTFTVDKPSYLTGTVKDHKGKPIKGAIVEMLTAGKKGAGLFYAAFTTDTKGRYKVYGVAPGKYKMRFYEINKFNTKPKYRLEYYNNRYTLKKAKSVTMPAGKNKTGVNIKLSAYTPPKADKKVKKLPFKVKANIHTNPREILTERGYVLPARVYSVKLNKGDTYELALGGNQFREPVMQLTDSKGYEAAGFETDTGDGGIAAGSFTPPKTDKYRIAVYDYSDYYSSIGWVQSRSGKFSLSVSKAFTPGSISGKVARAGGYLYENVEVLVYKKYGKRWVSYMCDYTDADGNYRVTGLKPGKYKVRFDGAGTAKYYKKSKTSGVKKKSKGSAVQVYAGGAVRHIDVKL
jgi:hypothetical protein